MYLYRVWNEKDEHLWCWCEGMDMAIAMTQTVLKYPLEEDGDDWCARLYDLEQSCYATYALRNKRHRGYIDTSAKGYPELTMHLINDYPYVEFKTRAEKIDALLN